VVLVCLHSFVGLSVFLLCGFLWWLLMRVLCVWCCGCACVLVCVCLCVRVSMCVSVCPFAYVCVVLARVICVYVWVDGSPAGHPV